MKREELRTGHIYQFAQDGSFLTYLGERKTPMWRVFQFLDQRGEIREINTVFEIGMLVAPNSLNDEELEQVKSYMTQAAASWRRQLRGSE